MNSGVDSQDLQFRVSRFRVSRPLGSCEFRRLPQPLHPSSSSAVRDTGACDADKNSTPRCSNASQASRRPAQRIANACRACRKHLRGACPDSCTHRVMHKIRVCQQRGVIPTRIILPENKQSKCMVFRFGPVGAESACGRIPQVDAIDRTDDGVFVIVPAIQREIPIHITQCSEFTCIASRAARSFTKRSARPAHIRVRHKIGACEGAASFDRMGCEGTCTAKAPIDLLRRDVLERNARHCRILSTERLPHSTQLLLRLRQPLHRRV